MAQDHFRKNEHKGAKINKEGGGGINHLSNNYFI